MFAQTRLVALQARADESLTLVARGNGTEFEHDYQRRMVQLIGSDGHGGLLGRRPATAPTRTAAESAAVRDVTTGAPHTGSSANSTAAAGTRKR